MFVLLVSLCVFLGHIFPIWLKFKGGKGIASFIGFLSVISWPLFVIFLFFWLIVVKIFKYSSLGAIVAIIFNLIIFKLTLYIQFKYYVLLWIPGEPSEFYITVFVSFIILIKHNIHQDDQLFMEKEKRSCRIQIDCFGNSVEITRYDKGSKDDL